MEVSVTKRFLMILTVLLLCVCQTAWAEETGETPTAEVISAESAASVSEENKSDAAETAQEASAEPAANESQSEATETTTEASAGPAAEESQPEGTEATTEENAEPATDESQSEAPETPAEEPAMPDQDAEENQPEEKTDAEHAAEHVWTEWEEVAESDVPVCERNQILKRYCQVCGQEEVKAMPASGHQWQAVSYVEATCTQDGQAVRRCALCGLEEVISLPAFGHSYVPDPQTGKGICAVCGAEQEAPMVQSRESHMYYNNTVTSFGPTTRELIGGSVWNRVTPVDLSEEGVFTYPLVASNQYTVGTATLVNGQDSQEVNYKLTSPKINVHSESLVIYPDLEALKTGTRAVSFDFNEPIDLKALFGENAHVIMAITLKADYDADTTGVGRFWADQNWIDQMMKMIK